MPENPQSVEPINPNPTVDRGDDTASPRSVATSWIMAIAILGAFAVWNPTAAKNTLTFVAVLSVLVFVHEWGHYQFARWAGMKVNRFAIGFPPWIYTKRHNGIDYSIGALPIGGMVDIAGLGSEEEMVATSKSNVESLLERTNIGSEADHRKSRGNIYRNENIPHGERQFQEASLGWRFLTLFAGPLMNFLFAIIVFIGVYSSYGVPVPSVKALVESVVAGSPAEKAGLKSGDLVVTFNSKPINDNEELARAIRASEGKPVTLEIERKKDPKAEGKGDRMTVNLTPIYKDIDGDGKKEPSIGVSFDMAAIGSFKPEKVSPLQAVQMGFTHSLGTSLTILDTIKRAFTRQLSKEEVKGIGGPVKIAQTINQAAGYGWIIAIHFSALLSVNLGLMNLLPFPALDGGRILFLAYELVVGRPFDPRKEGLVHAVGMVLLLAFMLFITVRDVLPMIKIG
jgi:regulator of sigma E protease